MKNTLSIKTLLASMALVITSGCASLLTDNEMVINVITSSGQQIKVTIDGMEFDVPGPVLARKDGRDKLMLTNDRNCANATLIRKKVEPSFWGNILFIYGSTTDYTNDKMWTYDEMTIISCSSS